MALELAEKWEWTIRKNRTSGVARCSMISGKMGVPDPILLKNSPLTQSEWEIMRMHLHTRIKCFPNFIFKNALEISYCHHEKWDGSGYPRGLKGEEYPAFRPLIQRSGCLRRTHIRPSLPRCVAARRGLSLHSGTGWSTF
ncbi:HD domain-containing phosphohydrolase [Candidatus Villigracilis proximus]|uniref:HD-GYP domain-containing protein n=1 Tax=Candidatus Villigracilis proximus TaxID=3140683 RepID=UPI0031EB7029